MARSGVKAIKDVRMEAIIDGDGDFRKEQEKFFEQWFVLNYCFTHRAMIEYYSLAGV
jgi:N-acetyl-gamma-glutamylphosphate reductase